MVVTFLSPTAEIGVTHDLVATPSIWTLQAPHWAIPQPNLVPVMPRTSRSTQSRGIVGSAFTSLAWPLTLIVAIELSLIDSTELGREAPMEITRNRPGREAP